MKLVLCTSGGLPGAAVLREFRSSKAVQVAGVVHSTRVLSPRYGFVRGALEQWRRSGAAYTAYLGCASLARLPADGLPVHRTRDVNDAASRAFVERLAPDLVVSAFFNQRVAAWIHGNRQGVNLHPSLLPALRGVDPVFYAFLRGERKLGVTLHRLAPEFDAGGIIAQREAPLIESESVLAGTVRLYGMGAALLLDSLESIRSGSAHAQQPGGDYTSWPTRAQVAEARAKGVRLVRARDLLDRAA